LRHPIYRRATQAHEECSGSLLGDPREGRIDLVRTAYLSESECQAEVSRIGSELCLRCDAGKASVPKDRDPPQVRQRLAKKLEVLTGAIGTVVASL